MSIKKTEISAQHEFRFFNLKVFIQDILGARQLRTACLSILMFLAHLAEVTP
jgi:hypothetical protein